MQGSAPIRVLVVEENPLDQELLHRELRKTNMERNVLFLSDPGKALELFHGPDASDFKNSLVAILLDEHFPDISGTDLLRLIRGTIGMEGFPVIVMTSSPPLQTAAACKDLNVIALVEKPVTLRSFSKAIANLFHRPQATISQGASLGEEYLEPALSERKRMPPRAMVSCSIKQSYLTKRKILNNIPKDGKKVRGGPGDGEEMPDEMAIPCFEGVKNHANRVSKTATDQPEQSIESQVLA